MSTATRPTASVLLLTALAMLAFAANSVLARLGLTTTTIDAATFTAVRLLSGALLLSLIVRGQGASPTSAGSWPSALALFLYAAAFSFAYLVLTTGTGALLLFGTVQLTMIGHGFWRGERFSPAQVVGLLLALGGLVYLLLPGIEAPPLLPAALMTLSGVSWGVYSLRGRGVEAPAQATAGNFVRAAPLALLLVLVFSFGQTLEVDGLGILYALLSGAVTSGLGYLVWYAALPSLRATTAATVQLSVPVIAALGGVLLLGEPLTLRLILATVAILGGIALVLRKR